MTLLTGMSRPFLKCASRALSTQSTIISKKSNAVRYMTGIALIAAGTSYFAYSRRAKEGYLDEYYYIPHSLISKEKISPDSYYLRVATEKQEKKEYPVPSCLYIKDDTIQVMRAYTPINDNPYKDGYIDLVVKKYENGSVSRTLTGFDLKDKIHIRGPMIEEYQYKENTLDEVGMIAGGTGISPMYQLICRILENPNDQKTKIWLIYGNKQEQDILLKSQLDELQAKYKDRLSIKYILDQPSSEAYEKGYVTKEMIEEMMLNEKRRKIFVCGPNKMLQSVCGERARDYSQGQVTGILFQLGLTSNEIWKFQ